MEPKLRPVHIIKDNLSLVWNGSVLLQKGKGKIDLHAFTHILYPLRSEIREFLCLRHNNTWNGMVRVANKLRRVNDWLLEHNQTIKNYADLDEKFWHVFLARCRLKGERGKEDFQNLRQLYEFGGDMLKSGVIQSTLSIIRKVKFAGSDKSKYIKTMHPQKGPLLRLEHEALRHRLKQWLLTWDDGVVDLVSKLLPWHMPLMMRRPEDLVNYANLM